MLQTYLFDPKAAQAQAQYLSTIERAAKHMAYSKMLDKSYYYELKEEYIRNPDGIEIWDDKAKKYLPKMDLVRDNDLAASKCIIALSRGMTWTNGDLITSIGLVSSGIYVIGVKVGVEGHLIASIVYKATGYTFEHHVEDLSTKFEYERWVPKEKKLQKPDGKFWENNEKKVFSIQDKEIEVWAIDANGLQVKDAKGNAKIFKTTMSKIYKDSSWGAENVILETRMVYRGLREWQRQHATHVLDGCFVYEKGRMVEEEIYDSEMKNATTKEDAPIIINETSETMLLQAIADKPMDILTKKEQPEKVTVAKKEKVAKEVVVSEMEKATLNNDYEEITEVHLIDRNGNNFVIKRTDIDKLKALVERMHDNNARRVFISANEGALDRLATMLSQTDRDNPIAITIERDFNHLFGATRKAM